MLASSFINLEIDNRFRIISVLGEGGMGIVFLAEQTELNRMVALKILEESLAEDEECKERFLREGKVLAALMHPNIVAFYNFGLVGGLPYLAMEYLKGKSLKQKIDEEGGMSWRTATELALQICSAMQYAHSAGVVHRDLKPNNIISLEDEPGKVKLLDFGLASIKDFSDQKQKLTSTGLLIGSVQYMSPEQCLGRRADNRSDIYSLACILYEMLSGSCPFDADSAIGMLNKHISEKAEPVSEVYRKIRMQSGETNSAFPPSLELILQKCMEKAPEDRYQSMDELAKDLTLVLENRESESAFLSSAEEHLRASRKEPSRNAFLLTPIIVILAGLLSFLSYKQILETKSRDRLNDLQPAAKVNKLPRKVSAAGDVGLLKTEVADLYRNGAGADGIARVQTWISARTKRGKKLTVKEDVDTSNMIANGEASLLRHDLGSARLEKKYKELEHNPEFTDQLKCQLLETKAGIDGWTGNSTLLYQIQDRMKKILEKSDTISSTEKAYHWLNNSSYLQQGKKFEEALIAIKNAEKEGRIQGADPSFLATIEQHKAGVFYKQGKVEEAQKCIQRAFDLSFENQEVGMAKTTELVGKGLRAQFTKQESSQRKASLAAMQADTAAGNGYNKIAADMLTEQLKAPSSIEARSLLLQRRAEHRINTFSTTDRNQGERYDRIANRQKWLDVHREAVKDFWAAYENGPGNSREAKRQYLAWRNASLTVLGDEKEAAKNLEEALKPVSGEKADDVRACVAKCIWATGSLWSLHGFYPECIPLYKKSMELYTGIPGMENQLKRAQGDYEGALAKWKSMEATSANKAESSAKSSKQ